MSGVTAPPEHRDGARWGAAAFQRDYFASPRPLRRLRCVQPWPVRTGLLSATELRRRPSGSTKAPIPIPIHDRDPETGCKAGASPGGRAAGRMKLRSISPVCGLKSHKSRPFPEQREQAFLISRNCCPADVMIRDLFPSAFGGVLPYCPPC